MSLPNKYTWVEIHGGVMLIDAEDLPAIENKRIHVGKQGYANFGYDKQRVHRVILNAPPHLVVDHINGNKLDNRKENLKLCTHSENRKNNRKYTNNTTGFLGVRKKGNRYTATVCWNYVTYHIGSFASPQKAYEARLDFIRNLK